MQDEKKIISLIDNNYSAREICEELSSSSYESLFSYDDLFNFVNNLKSNGIYYYPIYGNNGEIFYTKKKINSDDPIKFRATNGLFTFVVLSDIHVGSAYDDLKRLDIISDFILQKDIHFIFNAGDNIDGPAHTNQSMPRRIFNLEKQIEEFLRVYPQAFDLVTICALGDHDLGIKSYDNSSFNKILREKRHDIKVYSSGYGIIKVNDREILLCHDSNDSRIKQRLTDDMILIGGHSHIYRNNSYFNGKDMSLRFICPSSSKLPEYNGVASGFLKFDIVVENNIATSLYVDHFIFDSNNKIILAEEKHHSLILGDNYCRRRR